MSCMNPQGQMPYTENMAGQSTLSDLLGRKYSDPTTQTAAMPSIYQQQGGPYAQATGPASSTMPMPQLSPTASSSQLAPITPTTQPPAMTLESTQYLNGALRTLIGRKVTVSFLIGTNTYQDKSGTLVAVGANYIVLNDATTNNIVFCDYYTIKFVTVYPA